MNRQTDTQTKARGDKMLFHSHVWEIVRRHLMTHELFRSVLRLRHY